MKFNLMTKLKNLFTGKKQQQVIFDINKRYVVEIYTWYGRRLWRTLYRESFATMQESVSRCKNMARHLDRHGAINKNVGIAWSIYNFTNLSDQDFLNKIKQMQKEYLAERGSL